MFRTTTSVIALSALLSPGISLSALGDGGIRTVALSGTQASGLPAGVEFVDFFQDTIVINNNGDVVLGAELAGPGINGANDTGVFSEVRRPSATKFVQAGEQVPGLPAGVVFTGRTSNTGLTDDGGIIFISPLAGTGVSASNDAVLMSSATPSGFAPIARDGDASQGLAAGVTLALRTQDSAQIRGIGSVVIVSNVTGGGATGATDDVILRSLNGAQASVVARRGDPVGPNRVFGPFSDPSFTASGRVAFRSSTTPPNPAASPTIDIIFTDVGGIGLFRLISEGDDAPGIAGELIEAIIDVKLNNAGRFAFTGEIEPEDPGPARRVLWSGTIASGFVPLAIEGDQVPGAPIGVTFREFSDFEFNDNNDVAFVTGLNNADEGVCVGLAGATPALVASGGEQVPGLAPGIVFDPFGFSIVRLAENGQAAFFARFNDGFAVESGIFVADPDGAVRPVVIDGQLVDVNDDPGIEDLRTVSAISFAFDLNESQELVGYLVFTDGSRGVFVFSTASTDIPGDVNGDGLTTTADITLVVSNLGAGTPGAQGTPGDANADGETTTSDITFVVSNLGAGS